VMNRSENSDEVAQDVAEASLDEIAALPGVAEAVAIYEAAAQQYAAASSAWPSSEQQVVSSSATSLT
jgi:hypothetical protein